MSMRLQWMVLLAALLPLAGTASAQTMIAPPSPPPVEMIGAADGPPQSCSRVWASAEYLLWWTKNSPLPVPLVTIGNTTDLGVLGAGSTRLLIGNENLDLGTRSGARFTLGGWLDNEAGIGVEGSYFFLSSSSVRRVASVNGLADQVISVPFFDVTPGGLFGMPNQENAFVFGAPLGIVTDTAFAGIAVLRLRDELRSAEINGLFNAVNGDSLRVDLLGGFRYVYLRETLQFRTSSPTIEPPTPGEFFVTSDTFDASNSFYGGQVGARATWCAGALSVAATGKVALGVMHQHLGINGFLATNDFNTPFGTGPGQVFQGGYFALPSNIGTHTRDRFGVVPELGVNVKYQLTQHLAVSVGYTFLYLNNVIRPGEQIDRVINGNQSSLYTFSPTPPGLAGGPARPTVLFRDSDYWAQGISFGVEFRY
jgi:hypothetical protein